MTCPNILLAPGLLVCLVLANSVSRATEPQPTTRPNYPIVDTGQTHCFDDRGQLTTAPRPGKPFYGQDAFYRTNSASYRDNRDGTISDLVTGLMWTSKLGPNNLRTFNQALAGAKTCRVAGYDDWRLPTIKELYSLIDFNGCVTSRTPKPYIDTRFFEFRWGDANQGQRIIDAQCWTSTQYVGLTMRGNATVFGVNFADGRIKGYPRDHGPRGRKAIHFVRYVRGNPRYGHNKFVKNDDSTVSDLATGLMWTRIDSAKPLNWQQALAWAEDLELAGHDDWRLPNAKELHSIVDYTRAPDAAKPASRGPAIDPIFHTTNPEGWYWTSTTHLDGRHLGAAGIYIAFGRATGFMPNPRTGTRTKINVHGAGAQRSDPKTGDPANWPKGFGPQGDERRIYNFARAVRNIAPSFVKTAQPNTKPMEHVFSPHRAGAHNRSDQDRPRTNHRPFPPPPRR